MINIYTIRANKNIYAWSLIVGVSLYSMEEKQQQITTFISQDNKKISLDNTCINVIPLLYLLQKSFQQDSQHQFICLKALPLATHANLTDFFNLIKNLAQYLPQVKSSLSHGLYNDTSTSQEINKNYREYIEETIKNRFEEKSFLEQVTMLVFAEQCQIPSDLVKTMLEALSVKKITIKELITIACDSKKYSLKKILLHSEIQKLMDLPCCLYTFKGHTDWVYSAVFSPDGKTVASVSCDKTIKLWNTTTGTLLRTLEGHTDWIQNAVFSPDGKTVAAVLDKTIKLWHTTTGTLLGTLERHDALINSVVFSPDGKTVASASADKTIKLWDTTTGEWLSTLKGHNNWVNSVEFSPDGQTVASASTDRTIKLWNTKKKTLLSILVGHTDWVYSAVFSPDGKTVASASADTTVKLWNTTTGELLHTFKGHTSWVNSVVFSPDGKTVASASADTTVKLWNTTTGELLHTIEGHDDWVSSVVFSPDGETVASASTDETIKLWKVKVSKVSEVTFPQYVLAAYCKKNKDEKITLSSWGIEGLYKSLPDDIKSKLPSITFLSYYIPIYTAEEADDIFIDNFVENPDYLNRRQQKDSGRDPRFMPFIVNHYARSCVCI